MSMTIACSGSSASPLLDISSPSPCNESVQKRQLEYIDVLRKDFFIPMASRAAVRFVSPDLSARSLEGCSRLKANSGDGDDDFPPRAESSRSGATIGRQDSRRPPAICYVRSTSTAAVCGACADGAGAPLDPGPVWSSLGRLRVSELVQSAPSAFSGCRTTSAEGASLKGTPLRHSPKSQRPAISS